LEDVPKPDAQIGAVAESVCRVSVSRTGFNVPRLTEQRQKPMIDDDDLQPFRFP
jgi:hypothetical protein